MVPEKLFSRRFLMKRYRTCDVCFECNVVDHKDKSENDFCYVPGLNIAKHHGRHHRGGEVKRQGVLLPTGDIDASHFTGEFIRTFVIKSKPCLAIEIVLIRNLFRVNVMQLIYFFSYIIDYTSSPMIRNKEDNKVTDERNGDQIKMNVHFEVSKKRPKTMHSSLERNF